MKISEIEGNKGIVAVLVKDLQQKESKTSPYVEAVLYDGEKEIIARRWNMELSTFGHKKGDIIEVILQVGEYRGEPSYTIEGSRATNGTYNKEDFIKSAPIKLDQMYENIMKYIESMKDDGLKNVCKTLYETNKEKILPHSAAKAVHHNIRGGLLYHTLRMAMSAELLAKVYTAANRDLLLAGVLLHDIGKLKELNMDDIGNTTYTVEGNLFGHLYMGAKMVEDTADAIGLNTELKMQLIHIVVSHHGKQEWGAIQVPGTLEASLVHFIDNIDAQVYQYEEILKSQAPGTMTDKIWSLNGAHVYVPENKKEEQI